MDTRFILITPDHTLLDKRATRLADRLKKSYEVTVTPDTENLASNGKAVYVFPFSTPQHKLEELILSLPEGSVSFGGALHEQALRAAAEKGIFHVDLLSDEEFCQANALITAEAALSCIICSTENSIHNSLVAVFGYGRIGKRLTGMLLDLGASVKVFTSNKDELSLLSTRGIASGHLWQRQDIDSFSTVVNTVPLHHIIPRDTLARLDKSTYVLDLASGSNNVDWAHLKLLGLKGEHATSLPGKISPVSAAAAMERAILKHLS